MTDPITGVVLVGGKSSRFGSDKASALLSGRPLLQWVIAALDAVCDSIVVVRAVGQILPAVESPVPLVFVDDEFPASGPLAGLVSGMAATTSSLCFAVSCDAPLIRPGLVPWLAARADGHDAVCPDVGGMRQPLCAVYRPATCLPVFRELVEHDMLKLAAALRHVETLVVPEEEIRTVDPELGSFRNANRPETLAEIQRILDERS